MEYVWPALLLPVPLLPWYLDLLPPPSPASPQPNALIAFGLGKGRANDPVWERVHAGQAI